MASAAEVRSNGVVHAVYVFLLQMGSIGVATGERGKRRFRGRRSRGFSLTITDRREGLGGGGSEGSVVTKRDLLPLFFITQRLSQCVQILTTAAGFTSYPAEREGSAGAPLTQCEPLHCMSRGLWVTGWHHVKLPRSNPGRKNNQPKAQALNS